MPDDITNNRADQVLNDPSSYLFATLADFYREHGLFPEAIAICQSGLESQPDHVEGRLVLARCLLATGDRASARDEAAKVLGRQPEHAEAKRVLAEIEKAPPSVPASAPTPAQQPIPTSSAPTMAMPAAKLAAPVAEKPALPVVPVMSVKQEPQARLETPVKQETVAQPAIPAKPVPQPMDTVLPVPPPLAEPKPAVPAEAAAAAALPPAEAPDQQPGYARILSELQQTPQVLASLLVDEAGLVVAEAYAGAVAGATDSDASAALAINIFRTGAEAMEKIKLGALERVVVETATEKVFLRRAGPLLLLLSAENSVKMGLVAVNTKRAVERIAAIARG